MFILHCTDFYKTDHRRQYPKGTTMVYSNFTARGSRIEGIDSVVVFGIQHLVQAVLCDMFKVFFKQTHKKCVMEHYKARLDKALGENAVQIDHIGDLHDLGYLPIMVKALPEGSIVKTKVPFLTIYNTDPRFAWLPNFLETMISTSLWGMMTSATIAHEYRKIMDCYASQTSDIPEFVDYQGHDFSMRGMFGLQAAAMSGAGHLLSFRGTDTIVALDLVEAYYHDDDVGNSVPATEHSVMCMGGKESELETVNRLITEVYPSGVVSIVSDTWDYWHLLTDTLPKLKDKIMSRSGKVVIRPDSGDPVKIICGDLTAKPGSPEYKGSVEVLWDIFGGTTNSKGYKQLAPEIGLIYGDSITLDRCKEILAILASKGFASTNIVFGIGSYTYQYCTRDTFGFAMKATYGEINGVGVEIYKDPKTDDGTKKSAKGLLRVDKDGLKEGVTKEEEEGGMLIPVFHNGRVLTNVTFSDIRYRLARERREND